MKFSGCDFGGYDIERNIGSKNKKDFIATLIWRGNEMKNRKIDLKVRRARCWNCCAVVVIPVVLDYGRIVVRGCCLPGFIIPYKLKCPECGDEIYKYMCREESRFVH